MMVRNYSTAFISQEDYKKSSFPKKCLAGFMLGYAGFILHLRHIYKMNTEIFFKRYIASGAAPVIAVLPFLAIWQFYRVHCRVMQDIYQRTVGHMTDREMLELDIKFNPNKAMLYKDVLMSEDKK